MLIVRPTQDTVESVTFFLRLEGEESQYLSNTDIARMVASCRQPSTRGRIVPTKGWADLEPAFQAERIPGRENPRNCYVKLMLFK